MPTLQTHELHFEQQVLPSIALFLVLMAKMIPSAGWSQPLNPLGWPKELRLCFGDTRELWKLSWHGQEELAKEMNLGV